MRFFTRFTDEIFAALVAVIFIVEALDGGTEAPVVPDVFDTTTGRPWLVNLSGLPTWAIFASAVPAVMATILLFLDQNITTRLVNAPSHKLDKGPGFHLDLLVVGVITGACSIFGLPWIVAATVHALNHVKSLAAVEIVDRGGQKHETIVSVRENRVSPLCIHLLIAASIFVLPLIQLIPMAVLFGLFLFMGFATPSWVLRPLAATSFSGGCCCGSPTVVSTLTPISSVRCR